MQPNAFLLGAPKCGTTSIATWLADHPAIFVPHKEIHYFNHDHRWSRRPTRAQYDDFFARADPSRHRVRLDASVWYLCSDRAVPAIVKAIPEARFVVALRDPVDMVPSLHRQLCIQGSEDLLDFEAAWRAQDDRARGERIPSACEEPSYLQYARACALGAQVERLLERVSRDRVHFVLLDDLQVDPAASYQALLRFLDVPTDRRVDFVSHNASPGRRSHWLGRAVRWFGHVKHRLGVHRGLGLLDALDRANARVQPRPALPQHLTTELAATFAPDVARLSCAIGRPLTHWIKGTEPAGADAMTS